MSGILKHFRNFNFAWQVTIIPRQHIIEINLIKYLVLPYISYIWTVGVLTSIYSMKSLWCFCFGIFTYSVVWDTYCIWLQMKPLSLKNLKKNVLKYKMEPPSIMNILRTLWFQYWLFLEYILDYVYCLPEWDYQRLKCDCPLEWILSSAWS